MAAKHDWIISLAWQTWSQQSTLAIYVLIFLFNFYGTRLVIWYQVCRIGIKKKLWKVVFIYIHLPELGIVSSMRFCCKNEIFKKSDGTIYIYPIVGGSGNFAWIYKWSKKYVQIQNQIKSTSMQNLDSLWDICHFPTKLIIYV
jgi:hypothetical protein